MKSAISNAVTTYAQAADHRHPRSIRPTPVIGVPSTSLADHQAERIVELEGKLAAAIGRSVDLEQDAATLRGELHDARNRLQIAQGALELLALELGLPADTAPPEVLAEALRRIR